MTDHGIATQETPRQDPDDRYERLFVYGVFAMMSAGLFYYVWKYGRNVPFWDDWEMVSGLTGHDRTDWSWFFYQHSEHRYPVTRLVVLAAWRATGDLRVVMTMTVVLFSALTGWMIVVARRLRGRTAYTDAVFPLALLHWGHYENVIWTIQLFFVASAALPVGVTLMAIQNRWQGNLRALIAIALLLVLLPLHGAMGVVLTLPTALWCAYAGVTRWRAGDASGRRDAAVLIGASATALAFAGVYFVGFRPVPGHPPSPGIAAAAHTTLEVLALAFGPQGRTAGTAAGAAVLALCVGCLALLAVVFVARPAERTRAFALICCVGALTGVACAIGWGRSGMGAGSGYAIHYAILVAPILCVAYLAFVLYGPGNVGRLLSVVLFAALCGVVQAAYYEGRAYGIERAANADAMRLDAERGMPPGLIAKRSGGKIFPDTTLLALRLTMLRAEGASVFAGVDSEDAHPCARDEVVATGPVATNDVDLRGARAVATGEDPFLVYELPGARFVCTIDVTFVLAKPNVVPATLETFWMRSGVNEFAPGRRNEALDVVTSPDEQVLTIWVNDTIDRFRLDPDAAPATFEVRRIVLHERE